MCQQARIQDLVKRRPGQPPPPPRYKVHFFFTFQIQQGIFRGSGVRTSRSGLHRCPPPPQPKAQRIPLFHAQEWPIFCPHWGVYQGKKLVRLAKKRCSQVTEHISRFLQKFSNACLSVYRSKENAENCTLHTLTFHLPFAEWIKLTITFDSIFRSLFFTPCTGVKSLHSGLDLTYSGFRSLSHNLSPFFGTSTIFLVSVEITSK